MPPAWQRASDGLQSRATDRTSVPATRLVVTMTSFNRVASQGTDRLQPLGMGIRYAMVGSLTRHPSQFLIHLRCPLRGLGRSVNVSRSLSVAQGEVLTAS